MPLVRPRKSTRSSGAASVLSKAGKALLPAGMWQSMKRGARSARHSEKITTTPPRARQLGGCVRPSRSPRLKATKMTEAKSIFHAVESETDEIIPVIAGKRLMVTVKLKTMANEKGAMLRMMLLVVFALPLAIHGLRQAHDEHPFAPIRDHKADEAGGKHKCRHAERGDRGDDRVAVVCGRRVAYLIASGSKVGNGDGQAGNGHTTRDSLSVFRREYGGVCEERAGEAGLSGGRDSGADDGDEEGIVGIAHLVGMQVIIRLEQRPEREEAEEEEDCEHERERDDDARLQRVEVLHELDDDECKQADSREGNR
eukprot:scaffold230502_cov29-Tisochrysis_lutea.AAC.2